MKKTQRRRLYRGRRQRGGVNCRKLLAAVALALVPESSRAKASFGQLLTNYLDRGNWEDSKALADRVVSYVPSPNSVLGYASDTYGSVANFLAWPIKNEECPTLPSNFAVKTDTDAERVLEPYLLPVVEDDIKLKAGEYYEFDDKNGKVEKVYIAENINRGNWKSEPYIPPSDWKRYIVRGPVPSIVEEEEYGGRRRKQRRKTLRRKK